MDEKLTLYNQFFSKHERVTLKSNFKLEKQDVEGQIEVSTEKSPLVFDVKIPLGYPLSGDRSSIKFCCTTVKGYEHQNYDGSICLHPDPDLNIEQKLRAEMDLLFGWIKDFYIEGKRDPNYSYLLISPNKICLLFDGVAKDLDKHESGYFTFSSLGRSAITEIERFIVADIGGQKVEFAKQFQEPGEGNTAAGIWIYIKDEPVIKRREAAKSWLDLQSYFTEDNINVIYKYYRAGMKSNDKLDSILVLVGYDIPTSDGVEIHWDLIKIPSRELPIESVKENGIWKGKFVDQKIDWCATVNCSYDRFFGRGRLSDDITQSNILVLGLGAIGSSLSTILVRGGIREITITDFDIVEAGNICRSEYNLKDIKDFKILGLAKGLVTISPFVNVWPLNRIEKCLPGAPNYASVRESLKQYDLIFDCTTDMEMSYMLDKMRPKGQVFNLSITNKARELVCVTGKGNISKSKHQIFKKLSPESLDMDFYPEVGCQYPTFEAGYNDINVMVNLAIKNINHKYLNDLSQGTFVLRSNATGSNYNIEVDEY